MISISEYLVWIDCEMTGLNPEVDALIEIAVVITDSELNPVDEGIDIVVKPTPASVEQMNDFVRNMHTESGLITELDNGLELLEAQSLVLEYIQRFIPNAKEAPLAGNTIGTDRIFISKYLPKVDEHLHYRSIDVSSIKELSRRWYPRVYFQMPKKDGGHRALADILDSIRELRYYRETVFVELPGPTSADAQLAAEKVTKN
ncbi:MAG: oligoribonuclease [Microbacteriaceae bacterium]|nr:oligoribonuclease [Microbacteriaceae bacterium]